MEAARLLAVVVLEMPCSGVCYLAVAEEVLVETGEAEAAEEAAAVLEALAEVVLVAEVAVVAGSICTEEIY